MTTETKFVVGKWYKRGNGERIRVVCVDAPGEYPVIGHRVDGAVYTFTTEGFYPGGDELYLDLTLILVEPKREGVVWVTTYANGSVAVHRTKQEANDSAYEDCIARARVNWEEGQFDE